MIAAAQANHHRLRTVWHPSPQDALIYTENATIAVEKGLVKGQLNTAEFIDL